MIGQFKSKKQAKIAERKARNKKKYSGCYFYIDKEKDGSYTLSFSDPGLGLPW